MRSMLGLVFGALFVVGCAATTDPAPPAAEPVVAPERDYIIGDESFTAFERGEILKGAAFISAATGHAVPEIRWEPLPAVDQDMTIKRAHFEKGHLGNDNIGHFWMAIDADQVFPPDLSEVAAHEFGHGLGLQHIAGAGTMNWIASEGLHWTEGDEASCLELGVCDHAKAWVSASADRTSDTARETDPAYR